MAADAIGLREVLFQSITDMAPGAAIAASIPAGAGFAGGSLPLAVLLALVASLLTASCVGELAARIPAAGSMATFAAEGLHPSIGFLVAWGYTFAAALLPPLVLIQLGFTIATTIHSEWSAYPIGLWWPWVILGAAVIFYVGVMGIQTSTYLGSVLGAFEIVVFLVVGVLLVIHAGSHNTLQVFTTRYTPSAHRGMSGIIAGSIFTVLAFAGFEAATSLSEEARKPRQTVRRAVLLATAGVGALYVFTTYAVSVAYGPGSFAGFTGSGTASWEGLTRSFFGVAWIFVFFAIVNSTVANANAGLNVVSRMAFAMGRIRVFPARLATLGRRHRSPYQAITLSTAATVGLALGLGLTYGTTNAFDMLGTGIVIVVAAVYIVIDAACIGYFLRHREQLNPLLHIFVPILGILTFVPVWLNAAGIKVFSFISALTAPVSYMGPVTALWMLAGLIYLVLQYRIAPDRVAAVGRVYLDSEISSDSEQGV
ncbi:MAG: APC family permease [Actinomycetota bacterium]|nr:APC family permease [Actinomycetota bacterium]